MTAAVGNAAPSGVETLMQSGNAKVSGGGFRRHAAQTREARSGSSTDDTAQTPTRVEKDASQPQVDKTENASKRKSSKENADDGDSSFEDTFNSMGQGESKDAGPNVNMAPPSPLAELMIARQGSTPAESPDATHPLLQSLQGAVRSPALLKQKSILALIDAKDRQFADAGDAKSDSSNAGGIPTQLEGAVDVAPVTVDRREVHWNFNNGAVMSAAQQIAALQADGRPLPQQAPIQRSSAANVTQDRAPESQASKGTPQQDTPQAVAMPDADQLTNAFSSNTGSGAQSGEQLASQAAAAAGTDRKAAKTEAPASIDQIFSVSATSQQTPSGVTEQVRNGVVESLAGSKTDASAGPSPLGSANRPVAAPTLRTLDLTLSPADLGSVKLRLSLKSNSLSIEAEASKASTAKLLSDDRTNLERGLRDAGYDISSMKITDVSASTSSNASGWQGNNPQSSDGGQARSNFAGRQDGEMQRREGSGSMSDQSQRRQKEDNPQTKSSDVTNGRLGNAVYI